MKSLQQVVLIGMTVGIGAFLLWLFFRGGEDGIRVKGGSTDLHTDSKKGFESYGKGFRSKEKTKGCYDVSVTGYTNCAGDVSSLEGAKTIKVFGGQAEDDWYLFTLGHRFTIKDGSGWKLATDKDGDPILRYGTADFTHIEASTVAGKMLSCDGVKGTLVAPLKPVKCP